MTKTEGVSILVRFTSIGMARIIAGTDTGTATWSESTQFGKKIISISVSKQFSKKIHQPSWHDSMSRCCPDEAPVRTPWVVPNHLCGHHG